MNSILNWKKDLPTNWEVLPLKVVASYWVSSVDKLTKDDELPVELCNYTDVYKNEFITSSLEFMKASATNEELKKFAIQEGDVLITKDSETWDDIGIPALVVDSKPNLLCGYHLAIIRPDNDRIDSKFLFHCIQSKEIRIQLELASTGVTRFGLPKDDIGKLHLPVPALQIQKNISDYLDNEIKEIDRLIEAKENVLSILSEKKQSLITEAVIKGLNSDVRMKNAGIDWLGQVPEHREIKRIKYVTSKIGSGVTPKGGATVYQKEGIPLLRSQNVHFSGLQLNDVAFISEDVHASMSNSKVEVGDVLLNITGASIGRCFYYEGQLGEANVNQHVCILRPNEKILTKYLYYLLASELGQIQIKRSQVGGGREGLNFESLKTFIFPLPCLDEQAEIISMIEAENSSLKMVENLTIQTINLLKERRSAIVTSAITGHIEITSP